MHVLIQDPAIQTLGEEYTDIWQHSVSSYQPPSASARAALILLPTIPSYILARWGTAVSAKLPLLKTLLTLLDAASEANLALFYLKGTYYDLSKRFLGIRHVSS
jgi:peroxin-10